MTRPLTSVLEELAVALLDLTHRDLLTASTELVDKLGLAGMTAAQEPGFCVMSSFGNVTPFWVQTTPPRDMIINFASPGILVACGRPQQVAPDIFLFSNVNVHINSTVAQP